ncbi:ARM repeat-containing protein [Atractiella rhizophila]|nr:ARM repeat-containing protein [Atractiella rhizophila]
MDGSGKNTVQNLLLFLQAASTNPANPTALGFDLNYLDNFLRTDTKTYFRTLMEISSERDHLGREVRFQAAVQFKNGLEKGWRNESLDQETKAALRDALFNLALDADSLISKQAVQSVARVARFDLDKWPQLFSNLSDVLTFHASLETDEARILSLRSLQAIKAAIKALCSNRMMRGRLFMESMTPTLFPTLMALYENYFQRFRAQVQNEAVGEDQSGNDLMLSHLSFRCLSLLLVYGYPKPQDIAEPSSFFRSSVRVLRSLVSLRQGYFSSTTSIMRCSFKPLNKHFLAFGKLYRSFADKDNRSLLAMGEGHNILALYWGLLETATSDGTWEKVRGGDDAFIPESFVLQAMLVIKNLFFDWHGDTSGNDAIITDDQAVKLLQILVNKLLPLREKDLQNWHNDPETWISDEENEQWEVDIRPCAERVLMKLIPERSEVVCSQLARMVEESSAMPSNVLLKDGLYCALRQSTYLVRYLDFDKVTTSFISEALGTERDLLIVRRRIAWLLGHWIGERVSDNTQKNIYQILLHLMSDNPSTDLAVRLTAANSLVKGDSWDFNPDFMAPFLNDYLKQLFDLMSISALVETRIRLLNTLGVLVERMGQHFSPYAVQLMQTLKLLWEGTSDDENYSQMRIAVLQTLLKLVKADVVFDESSAYLSPLIYQALVDESQILREDGLYLLSSYLQRLESLTPEIASLLPHLASLLLQGGTDSLPSLARIIESYLLLNATYTLESVGKTVLASMAVLLETLDARAIKLLQHVLKTLLLSSSPVTWSPLLDISGIFSRVISIVTTDVAATTVVLSRYLTLISRIIIYDVDTFYYLLMSSARSHHEEILNQLLRVMVDKFENLSSASGRKLISLALAHLCSKPNVILVQNLPSFVDLWCLSLAECQDEEEDLSLYGEDGQSDFFPDDETAEARRRIKEFQTDPALLLQTRTIINEKLQELQAAGSIDIHALIIANSTREGQDSWNELVQRLNGSLRG